MGGYHIYIYIYYIYDQASGVSPACPTYPTPPAAVAPLAPFVPLALAPASTLTPTFRTQSPGLKLATSMLWYSMASYSIL